MTIQPPPSNKLSKRSNIMKSNLNRGSRTASGWVLYAALFLALVPPPGARAGYPTVIDDNADLYQMGHGGPGLPARSTSPS